MVIAPPIKSQGIKTRLVDWIRACSETQSYERWVEPFAGTGAVAFNVRPEKALLCDSNPHLIAFYQSIRYGKITPQLTREYLSEEGEKLLQTEGRHYYEVRDRFNAKGDPLDFLFLSRACFNGLMRFNKDGGFNVPFCRKPQRFAKALVTKICNQVESVSNVIAHGDYEFRQQDFKTTLLETGPGDMVYCDPPYIGRHVNYYDGWTEEQEACLESMLADSNSRFILSTWLKNKYRINDHVFSFWGKYSIQTREHFYHIGGKETNRNAIYEALLVNFETADSISIADFDIRSLSLAGDKKSGKQTITSDSPKCPFKS